jgi:hypothetical protein
MSIAMSRLYSSAGRPEREASIASPARKTAMSGRSNLAAFALVSLGLALTPGPNMM